MQQCYNKYQILATNILSSYNEMLTWQYISGNGHNPLTVSRRNYWQKQLNKVHNKLK